MVLSSLVKAVSVRLIFFFHSFVTTWRVVVTFDNSAYWCLLILLLGNIAETLVIIQCKKGEEWMSISPAILCYLVSVIPGIWLLELHLMGLRHRELGELHALTQRQANLLLGVEIPISLSEPEWTLALEQTMFFILITGRWMLPRGKISRKDLSQLLLAHLGMTADIIEFFEIFEEKEVFDHPHLIYPILTLWTWSLLQYTLTITASSNPRRIRSVVIERNREGEATSRHKVAMSTWNPRVFGIVTNTVLQDLPFFTFRVYVMTDMGVISHMMVFFTCKNALVILLQIYRLFVIATEPTASASEFPESNVRVIRMTQKFVDSFQRKNESPPNPAVWQRKKALPMPRRALEVRQVDNNNNREAVAMGSKDMEGESRKNEGVVSKISLQVSIQAEIPKG